jgi:general secretion pathway protein F
MEAFEYSALDSDGQLQKGMRTGDSSRQIRQILRDQGMVPISVEPVSANQQGRRFARWHRKPRVTALALVTRQLATMIKSGAVLGEALRIVAEQTDQPWAKKVFSAVRAHVQEGRSLAAAMAEFPEVFPDIYQATIDAGERTGQLDLVLERLADYTEFKQQLRQKMVLALAYPLLLSIVALLIVIGLLSYVIPQIITVFRNIDQQLPLLTRMVINISDLFRANGLLMIVVLTALFVLFQLLMRKPLFKRKIHGLLLSMPVLGRFLRGLEVARFARTFSILVASGVSALEGMRVSAEVINNLILRDAVKAAARGVREGNSINKSLAATGVFPPMVIYLIASGETSADLAQMLDQAATSQEKEVEMMTGLTTAIFEPVLILLMGGMVLLIVLAILMPVFELNQLVR